MEYTILPSQGYEGFRDSSYYIPSHNLGFREVWTYVTRLNDVMTSYPDTTFVLDLSLFPKDQHMAFTMLLSLKNIKVQ